MAAGLAASAPWIIFDDGWRAMSASFPLVAVVLASGFRSRAVLEGSRVAVSPAVALLLLSAAAVSIVAAPTVAHWLDRLKSRELRHLELKDGELWVLGGAAAAGLLVVPDGQPLPKGVPSVHFGDFRRAVDLSAVEYLERVVYPSFATRSFGFVRSVGSVSGPVLVTPPEVVLRRDIGAWRLTLDPSSPPPERYERPLVAGQRTTLVGIPARRYFLFVDRAAPAATGEH